MTRIPKFIVAMTILSHLAVTQPSPAAAQQLVFDAFPVSAVVRGENIRLRLDPALDTEVETILQRGDPITITGEATSADGEEFYPVEADLTGETGWIRALFIDPRSIAAPSSVVVPLDDVEPADDEANQGQQDREGRRQARQTDAAEEPAPELEPAPEPEPEAESEESGQDRAARRAARQENQTDAQAENEQPANDRATQRAGRQGNREANGGNQSGASGALAFNGTGPTVTETFPAPADVLTITANYEGSDTFVALAVTADGAEVELFNENGPFNAGTTFETETEATLVLEIEADGPWEVVIEPAN